MILTKLTPSMSLTDIQNLMHSKLAPTAHLSSDTRMIQEGDVFFAYPVGQGVGRSDNRKYISEALGKGAALVFYECSDELDTDNQNTEAVLNDPRCIGVVHLAQLVSQIADWWYDHPSMHLRVMGITGTNGKTTISHWLAKAFEKQGNSAVVGTLGYGRLSSLTHTGFTTPDAARVQRILAELRAQSVKYVAMEVSSHALEQSRVKNVQFTTAIFSNITQDHLDYHGSMEAYIQAKFELFQSKGLQYAIVNMDDISGRRLVEELVKRASLEVWVYGSTQSFNTLSSFAQASVRPCLMANIQASPVGMKCDCTIANQTYSLQLDCLGEFNVANAVAVLTTLIANQIPIQQALETLKHFKAVDGRMERINPHDTDNPLMLVDYAHTPDALEKTLQALRPMANARNGKLICVFGCGGNRDSSKRPLMGKIAAHLADRIILTSDNPRHENPELIIDQIISGIDQTDLTRVRRVTDRAFAILTSVKNAHKNDIVLVAGKGHERTQEIAGNQFVFSDQDHIRLAMRGVS